MAAMNRNAKHEARNISEWLCALMVVSANSCSNCVAGVRAGLRRNSRFPSLIFKVRNSILITVHKYNLIIYLRYCGYVLSISGLFMEPFDFDTFSGDREFRPRGGQTVKTNKQFRIICSERISRKALTACWLLAVARDYIGISPGQILRLEHVQHCIRDTYYI